MEKLQVWNNQGYFEYLDKDELFESSSLVVSTSKKPVIKKEEKHERFCRIESYEKAIQKQNVEIVIKPYKPYSPKYDDYFDTDDSYGYSIGSSFNSIAYGKTNDYLNKNDFNYREYGSRFGSSVVCDDYDN